MSDDWCGYWHGCDSLFRIIEELVHLLVARQVARDASRCPSKIQEFALLDSHLPAIETILKMIQAERAHPRTGTLSPFILKGPTIYEPA